jgi:hypothetical protein
MRVDKVVNSVVIHIPDTLNLHMAAYLEEVIQVVAVDLCTMKLIQLKMEKVEFHFFQVVEEQQHLFILVIRMVVSAVVDPLMDVVVDQEVVVELSIMVQKVVEVVYISQEHTVKKVLLQFRAATHFQQNQDPGQNGFVR